MATSDYKINGTPISNWGVFASPEKPMTLAVTGCLDLPSRKGDTEYNWGTETEIFVNSADIEFEGREMTFRGFIQSSSVENLLIKLDSFKAACLANNVAFQTPVGTFNVFVKGEIKVDEFRGKPIAFITIPFYEETVSFVTLPAPIGSSSFYSIGGYNLNDNFGAKVTQVNDSLGAAQMNEVKTTATYKKTQYREPRDMEFKCAVIATSLSALATNTNRLAALLASPGTKEVAVPYGETIVRAYYGYCKEGMKVEYIGTKAGNAIAELYFKMRIP